MFRLAFAALLTVLSFGCIPVDDLGEYWDQGVVDEELIGDWKSKGKYPIENEYLSITRDQDVLIVHTLIANDFNEEKGDVPERCKTLVVGKFKYCMIDGRQWQLDSLKHSCEQVEKLHAKEASQMDPEYLKSIKEKEERIKNSKRYGGLQFYKIENDVLTQYFANEYRIQEAIQKDPSLGKVDNVNIMDDVFMETAMLTSINIPTIKFLQRIAESEEYWRDKRQYKRITNLSEDLAKSRTYIPDNPQNLVVVINQPTLKYFCDGRLHILRRHLQASPEWQVVQEGRDEVVCYRREWDNEGFWREGYNGFHLGETHPFDVLNSSYHKLLLPLDQEKIIPSCSPEREIIHLSMNSVPMTEKEIENAYQIRTAFHFAEKRWNPQPHLPRPRHYAEIHPEAEKVTLNLRYSNQGYESLLSVGQKGLWFEFFEQTALEDRRRTRSALHWLRDFLNTVRGSEEEIGQRGYAKQLIEPDFIQTGTPHITFKQEGLPGYISINAFVNPGQQGFVYLKARDTKGENYIDERYLNWGSNEYIGWSEDKNTLFFYQANTNIPDSIIETMDSVRFEIWFRPSSEEPDSAWFDEDIRDSDRKLIEATLNLK